MDIQKVHVKKLFTYVDSPACQRLGRLVCSRARSFCFCLMSSDAARERSWIALYRRRSTKQTKQHDLQFGCHITFPLLISQLQRVFICCHTEKLRLKLVRIRNDKLDPMSIIAIMRSRAAGQTIIINNTVRKKFKLGACYAINVTRRCTIKYFLLKMVIKNSSNPRLPPPTS